MACGEFVKGHVFDFDTLICGRCGMMRTRFEAAGQPRCSGQKPKSSGHEATRTGPVPKNDD